MEPVVDSATNEMPNPGDLKDQEEIGFIKRNLSYISNTEIIIKKKVNFEQLQIHPTYIQEF